MFTVFDIDCGETRFGSLHLGLQYTQRIKTVTSSETVYPLGIEERDPLGIGPSLLCLFSWYYYANWHFCSF